ncbi:MerR family transcriptional regulator [Prauserella sp. ASG 168]|uniref:MerR family transcriptional regulator n=1 Tax=Prauserella cavernicola TaxID=2800127 RepID=A0A934QZC6_9PSEU|nr:MerR family transcriptional regulator [Prauserella cavernicola]
MPVAAVARRLGVAPSTLRTWDRRYGLGPSRHTGGRHRRYGSSDVVRLELMQRALLRGASTAEAARYALANLPKAISETAPPAAELFAGPPDGEVVLGADRDQAPDFEGALGPPRFARQLSTAALAMDVRAVQHLLAEAIGSLGVLEAWEGVVRPVVTALGAADERAEVRYLLTECVFGAMVRATPVLSDARNQRPVLLCSVPEERDTLAVYVLAAALAERHIVTQLFGVPLPADVLAVAVRRSAPSAVVLWAQRGNANPRLFTRISRGRQRGRLFACGPAWHAEQLPPKVELLGDVRAAADRVEYVLLGGTE